jgi:Putative auto-transporter adhesin, head GIN domain
MRKTFGFTRTLSGNRKALSSILIVILVIGVVMVVAGVIVAYIWFTPGSPKTETMSFSDFTALEAGSAIQVNIAKSDTYSVKITAGERIFDRIQVTQTGETLKIEVTPGIFFGTFDVKAEITMPMLSSLELSGATKGTVDGFSSTEQFSASLSGASLLEMTNFELGDVNFELSGASHLIASGAGNDLISEVSGASNLDLTNFHVNDANVILSGASHVTINLDGRLDVQASGLSNLEYIGEPTLGTINTSGGSNVNKK